MVLFRKGHKFFELLWYIISRQVTTGTEYNFFILTQELVKISGSIEQINVIITPVDNRIRFQCSL